MEPAIQEVMVPSTDVSSLPASASLEKKKGLSCKDGDHYITFKCIGFTASPPCSQPILLFYFSRGSLSGNNFYEVKVFRTWCQWTSRNREFKVCRRALGLQSVWRCAKLRWVSNCILVTRTGRCKLRESILEHGLQGFGYVGNFYFVTMWTKYNSLRGGKKECRNRTDSFESEPLEQTLSRAFLYDLSTNLDDDDPFYSFWTILLHSFLPSHITLHSVSFASNFDLLNFDLSAFTLPLTFLRYFFCQ